MVTLNIANANLTAKYARKQKMLTRNDFELINYKVNLLPYKSDALNYFTPEFWTRITGRGGDCEDFGIEKYLRLLDRGCPAEWLRLATCWVSPGMLQDEYHAVLIISFGGEDLTLDNRYPHPMEKGLLPYQFHKLQVTNSQEWEYEKSFADKYPHLCIPA